MGAISGVDASAANANSFNCVSVTGIPLGVGYGGIGYCETASGNSYVTAEVSATPGVSTYTGATANGSADSFLSGASCVGIRADGTGAGVSPNLDNPLESTGAAVIGTPGVSCSYGISTSEIEILPSSDSGSDWGSYWNYW